MSAIKNISLYIPHVFPNFSYDYVEAAFKDIGDVCQVDFVHKLDRNGNDYKAAYIHFNKWYNTKTARDFYEKVTDENQEARLVHDDPWYWIVLPNTAKKHVSGDRKARIDLGDAKVVSASNIAPSLQTTPVKQAVPKVCPGAPMKKSYADAIAKQDARQSLQTSFDEVAEFHAEIETEMDEIEEMIEAEDENLVSIDGRYVETLEQANWAMNQEIAELRAALINLDQMYQAEVAKVRAFANVEL